MERLHADHFQLQHLKHEHEHRYRLLARIAYGDVVDCACGVGYASTIFTGAQVHSYRGFDVDTQAIEYARQHFESDRCRFTEGSILALPLQDASVDTFASLETLEHLHEPHRAADEVARVLRDDGIFVGTVPTRHYDERCEAVYGTNPYHVTRFDESSLEEALRSRFPHIWIGYVSYGLASMITPVGTCQLDTVELQEGGLRSDLHNGSFVFLASRRPIDALVNTLLPAGAAVFYAMPKVDLDEEQIAPLYKTIADMDTMIVERDALIRQMENMIEDRNAAIRSNEKMITERDILLSRYESMHIRDADRIRQNDDTLREKDELLQQRAATIKKLQSPVSYFINSLLKKTVSRPKD
ncbi:MAG: class I SAM-dependent methyltransferase [Burkholderia gladioli]|uniref:class I SAM-dependent methyltransferase n=1 Tax=Burkholderia gladioli TaxID=28095 RepID=UPI00163F5EE1|nr:class I SAM-dependent methyltransferase [Burkholderia gladioli]